MISNLKSKKVIKISIVAILLLILIYSQLRLYISGERIYESIPVSSIVHVTVHKEILRDRITTEKRELTDTELEMFYSQLKLSQFKKAAKTEYIPFQSKAGYHVTFLGNDNKLICSLSFTGDEIMFVYFPNSKDPWTTYHIRSTSLDDFLESITKDLPLSDS